MTETIKTDYFFTLPRIDRPVFYEKVHSNRGYGTFPSKPSGSGVGKTEVTNIIARYCTDEKPIKLNMAEFYSEASINRLIGAPAGYVGYESNAEMPFDILDTNPYQVIELNEFDQAHKSVQDLFMNVFEEGYLKDNNGKTIDFSKSIIIATTNAGRMDISSPIGFNKKSIVYLYQNCRSILSSRS